MNRTIGRRKRLTVELEHELHRLAKLKSYEEGKTISEKMEELIKDWLNISD